MQFGTRGDAAMSSTDPLHMPATSKGIWIIAAVVALSLHIAFAAFVIMRLQQEARDDLGAAGIVIGVELMSPQVRPTELPAGPDSEASMASPAVAEQKAEAKEVDAPKQTPVEAETSDLAVREKPRDEDPDNRTKQTKASEESIAQEATAAPSLQDAPQGPKSVTVDQGTGESRQRLRTTWQKELLAHLDRHKRYPTDRSQKAAQIVLQMHLDRMGRVVSVNVAQSSGDAAFDAAAVAMVQRADPVPAPPPLVADEGLSFLLPVHFRVAGRR